MANHSLTPDVSVILEKNSKFLMLKRQNTGYMDGKWGLPAGHVEPGESATQAARREVQEEAGVVVKELELVHIMQIKKDDERIKFYFKSTRWEGDVKNCEPQIHEKMEWFEKLPDDIIPYYREVFAAIEKNKMYSEIGFT